MVDLRIINMSSECEYDIFPLIVLFFITNIKVTHFH
jgi:hypothetical protein